MMTYPQYRAVRRLVHECCNYQDGNCLLLDDGEECVCVQSISYSLICKWFRVAVLPLDGELCAALLHREDMKKCVLCGCGYLPYPRFLMEADLALATKLVYAVLLDRAQLSQANGWADEQGQIYIVFPIVEIANAIDRSPMTVKNALAELETAGLIERRRRGQSQPNRIYVKIPDGQDIVRLMDKKLSTNNPTSNLTELPYGREGACARAFGRYGNVFLTEAEVAELQADFPSVWQEYIERLSEYMASTGKTYKSHAATIRRWAKEDRRKGKGVSDYSCKEGESL